MRRWLKEKKKDKKSSLTSCTADDGTEDDYGFDRDRQASKSPPSKRQLPPTPAAPEEKSLHIYEEITDLTSGSLSENEKAVHRSKGSKRKNGGQHAARKSSVYRTSDDINPYMVVPVDKEGRHTPPDFHRNGTPEVHCDVIVKETHCEILMSRKPKVSLFKLSSTTSPKIDNNSAALRNNTHFCAQDRRVVPTDIHSTSRAVSTAVSQSNYSDAQDQSQVESNDTSTSGIIPYTCASNFIPRTKLAFNRLSGKDPRKEAFGSDCSDYEPDSQSFITARLEDDVNSPGANGVSYASLQEISGPSKCLPYSSLIEQNGLGTKKLESVNDDQCMYRIDDSQTSFISNKSSSLKHCNKRPTSPSNSSSCTYASVNFPSEPKIYNTIPELTPNESISAAENDITMDSDVVYSSVSETFANTKGARADMSETFVKATHNIQHCFQSHRNTHFKLGSCADDAVITSNFHQGKNVYPRADNPANKISNTADAFTVTQSTLGAEGGYRQALVLDFCSCNDDQSSTFGGIQTKTGNEDDSSSVAGTGFDGAGSCRGCGRLIRQITYSESFSDETYEHVYSSRLLIRNGRVGSDTKHYLVDTSSTELLAANLSRSPDFMSRDDTWALSSRSDDTLPPAYGACDDNGFISNYSESLSLKRRDSDVSAYRVYRDSKGLSVSPVPSPKHFIRQSTPPSEASMFCSLRATVSTSSMFSTRKPEILNVLDTFPQQTYETISNSDIAEGLSSNSHLNHEGVTGPSSLLASDQTIQYLAAENTKLNVQTVSQSDSKQNSFSGLLSKLTRSKSSKAAKSEPSDTNILNSVIPFQTTDTELRSAEMARDENTDKSVKKLSKFFQRLSNKEGQKLPNSQTSVKLSISEDGLEQIGLEVSELLENELLSSDEIKHFKDKTTLTGKQNEIGEHTLAGQLDKLKSQSCPSDSHSLDFVPSNVQCEVTRGACTGAFDVLAAGKTQANTDSGDTCYEYDMSTSSEGEQASYDHFLSKVKKTLNLEQEVQHISDTQAPRKRLLCKACKKDEQLSVVETIEAGASGSSYWFCPHLSAKFGDLRAIFDDLVIDQRAAILDCLTDYAHGPYSFKFSPHENHCNDCGSEVNMTDSESLATIYNLLSHPLNYPSAHTPSCDSDEGTMADNSCESGDEINNNNKHVHSSQTDNLEPEPPALLKNKKKDLKDRKYSPVAWNKENWEKSKHTNGQNDSKTHKESQIISSSRKNAAKKISAFIAPFLQSTNNPLLPDPHDAQINDSKSCPVIKPRPANINDKAIQDIYSPLPSKALSLLTSKGYGANSNDSACSCERNFHISSTSVDAFLARSESFPSQKMANMIKENSINKSEAPFNRSSDSNNCEKISLMQTFSIQNSNEKTFLSKGERDDRKTRIKSSANSETKISGANESSLATCYPDIANKDSNDMTTLSANLGAGVSAQQKCWKSSYSSNFKSNSNLNAATYSGATESCGNNVKDNSKYDLMSRKKRDPMSLVSKIADVETTVSGDTKRPPPLTSSDVNRRLKSVRKSKLEWATLDLLPETALGGDADHEVREKFLVNKISPVKPKRSCVIEKMTQIFEGNNNGNNESKSIQKVDLYKNSAQENNICKAVLKNAVTNSVRTNSIYETRLEFTSVNNDLIKTNESKSMKQNASMSENENERSSLPKMTSEPRSAVLNLKFKSAHTKPNNNLSSQTKIKDIVASKQPAGTLDVDCGVGLYDGQQPSPPSPHSSTSNTSSSAAVKKKTSGKQKKLNRKSQKKRSRSRSERSKGSSSKGEKTLYYLSSDLSDIDVVEVEDWDTYAKSLSPSQQQQQKENMDIHSCDTDSPVYDEIIAPDASSGGQKSTQKVDMGRRASDQTCDQEIYALPPSSAELRSAREFAKPGDLIVTNQSPELPKHRNKLRTDVYKTFKNNNKLLSDVIIRNYDIQNYGNV